MSLRWLHCPQPTPDHLDTLSSCELDDLQLPALLLTCCHPNLQDCYKYQYMYCWRKPKKGGDIEQVQQKHKFSLLRRPSPSASLAQPSPPPRTRLRWLAACPS